MLEAGLWGLLAASTLVIGALIGLYVPISRRVVALTMAFGAGALVSALAFDLTEEAFNSSNGSLVGIGLALGALTFYFGNRLLSESRRGARVEPAASSNGRALALGALLDGIPESIVLGSTLLGGADDQRPVSGSCGHLEPAGGDLVHGRPAPRGTRCRLDHAALDRGGGGLGHRGGNRLRAARRDGTVLGAVDPVFAAGAILTMLVDTMIPEAFEGGGNLTGLVTVAGFALAFLLTSID